MKLAIFFTFLSFAALRVELVEKMSIIQLKVIAPHLSVGFFSDFYTLILILSLSSLICFLNKKYFKRAYVLISFVFWGFSLSNALYYKFFGSHLSWWVIEKHYSDTSWIAGSALNLSLSIPVILSGALLLISYFLLGRIKEEKRVFDISKKKFQIKYLVTFALLFVLFILLRQSPKWFNYKEKHTAFNSQLYNIWNAEAIKDSYIRRKNDVLLGYKSKSEVNEAIKKFKNIKLNFRKSLLPLNVQKNFPAEPPTTDISPIEQSPESKTSESPEISSPESAEYTWIARTSLGYGKTVPINIIWVILESVRTYEFDHPELGNLIFPNLKNLLNTKGVYFKNFYNSSFGAGMSARGQFTMLCSSLPKMHGPGTYMLMGTLDFPCLPSFLTDKKLATPYQTLSLMGFPAHFHNQKYFESYQGMQTFYDNEYFEKLGFKKIIGDWGLADEILFEEGLKILIEKSKSKKPIFARFSTVSTHVPHYRVTEVDLPESILESYNDQEHYLNYLSTLMYVDRHLSKFIQGVFNEPLLQNTVIMVTGDHGIKEYLPDEMDLKQVFEARFRVPAMIFSNTLSEGKVSERLSHHMDFANTTLDLAGIMQMPGVAKSIESKWMGKNLFSMESTPWIFRAENELAYKTDQTSCYKPTHTGEPQCFDPKADVLYGNFEKPMEHNQILTDKVKEIAEAVEALISLNAL